VTSLVRAELIKLRSTRMPLWLLMTALALVVLLVLVTIPSSDKSGNELSLHDSDLLARVIGVAAAAGQVVVLVLGILAFTQEFRFGTATSTFLVEPARQRVLAAKALALAVAGVVCAAATMPLSVALSALVIDGRGGTVGWSGELVAVLAAAVAVMAVYGPIGVALGAIVRNQIAAVAGALVWLLAVEGLLVTLVPAIGRWMPGGATVGLLQEGRAATTHGALLPAWAGGLMLLAYAAAAGTLAARFAMRRDLG
jgi:ABC-2 type transport system permease protein